MSFVIETCTELVLCTSKVVICSNLEQDTEVHIIAV